MRAAFEHAGVCDADEFGFFRDCSDSAGADVAHSYLYAADELLNSVGSWQRGKNENTNGRLRRIFSKSFDLSTITQSQLDQTVHLINHTPRKPRGWKTPAEVYETLCCKSV